MGRAVCSVPFPHILDTTIDRGNPCRLRLSTWYDDKLGLMRQRVSTYPGLSYSRPVWHLALDFDSPDNCRAAKQHVEEGRLRVRGEKRETLERLLKETMEKDGAVVPPVVADGRVRGTQEESIEDCGGISAGQRPPPKILWGSDSPPTNHHIGQA